MRWPQGRKMQLSNLLLLLKKTTPPNSQTKIAWHNYHVEISKLSHRNQQLLRTEVRVQPPKHREIATAMITAKKARRQELLAIKVSRQCSKPRINRTPHVMKNNLQTL